MAGGLTRVRATSFRASPAPSAQGHRFGVDLCLVIRDSPETAVAPGGVVAGWGHVLDPEQRQDFCRSCPGRAGYALYCGDGGGLARQALCIEKIVDDVVAVTALPHAHVDPTRDALAWSRRSVGAGDRVTRRGRGRQQRIRLSSHQYGLDAAGRPLVYRFNRTDGGLRVRIPFAVFEPTDGLDGDHPAATFPRKARALTEAIAKLAPAPLKHATQAPPRLSWICVHHRSTCSDPSPASSDIAFISLMIALSRSVPYQDGSFGEPRTKLREVRACMT